MSTLRRVAELPPMDVPSRLERLRALIGEGLGRLAPPPAASEQGAGSAGPLRGGGAPAGPSPDAVLVTKLESIRYLTGFTGSAGMLLVTTGRALLLTDGRYRDQSLSQLAAAGVEADVEIDRPPGQLERLARASKGLRALALEEGDVSWMLQQRLAGLLDAPLVFSHGAVERLRMVKDAGELARIEAACDVADVALAQVKERMGNGCTERELAAELEAEMRRRGASGAAFETIVASGPNAALPHARPTDRVINPGELVVVDFGATVDGYRSDMTRTLCAGAPDAEMRELVEAVFAAQRAGVRALRAGVAGGEVDRACRESLEAAGLGDAFTHGTGHGVGLEIHEAPSLGRESADILAAGSVVTVEPGAYLPERGGARIEDTLVVTDTGARALTKSTKDYTL